MPVRARIVENLTHETVGYQVWDGLTGRCKTVPTADYHEAQKAADVLFERIVDAIDWPRVLIEACSRHFDLVRAGAHKSIKHDIVQDVCGDCLHEALLADEHMPRHSPVPLPRIDTGQDWLGILAAMRQKYGRSR